MKKTVPLYFGCLVGLLAIVVFYVPAHQASEIEDTLLSYFQILAAAAFILGGINVAQVNWPKIRRREPDWGYKIVLLVSAVFMLMAGVAWDELLEPPKEGIVAIAQGQVTSAGKGLVHVNVPDPHTMVWIDDVVAEKDETGLVQVEVDPGKHKIKVAKAIPGKHLPGFSGLEKEVEIPAGATAVVSPNIVMKWGDQGRVFNWLYDYVFFPCNATMFALLAFFIASAAFRAFRARNVEAALLLAAAILVMIGRVPVGRMISEWFPVWSDWLVDVPNNAGRRAIMMGAALGAVATGLRVILGLERSHLGADS